MKHLVLLLTSLFIWGCAKPVALASASDNAPSPLELTPETKRVVLKGGLATFGPTIIVPRDWNHRFEPGEDSQRHYLDGYGVKAILDYWVEEPRLKCTEASCRTLPAIVGGNTTQFVIHSDAQFEIFLPEGKNAFPQPRRGIWMQVSCETADGCRLAQRIAQSVRF